MRYLQPQFLRILLVVLLLFHKILFEAPSQAHQGSRCLLKVCSFTSECQCLQGHLFLLGPIRLSFLQRLLLVTCLPLILRKSQNLPTRGKEGKLVCYLSLKQTLQGPSKHDQCQVLHPLLSHIEAHEAFHLQLICQVPCLLVC